MPAPTTPASTTPAATIRLLVAEDSAYMLMAIRTMVKLDPRIEIVGEARDGAQAVELARTLRPDIITMDVNMPGLSGIAATRRIMAEAPTVIVMLSSMTEAGVAITQDALDAGAVDYLPKSLSAVDVDLATIATRFAGKIEFWGASARTMRLGRITPPRLPADTDLLVVTGGYGSALVAGMLIGDMPRPAFPIVVALDELSPSNTTSFVRYLSTRTECQIQEGRHRSLLAPGVVTVLPGGRKSILKREGGSMALDLRSIDPAADLMTSVLACSAHPSFAFLSGAARPLDWLAGRSDRTAPLWIQDPRTCALAALPHAVIGSGFPASLLAIAPPTQRDRAA